MGKNEFSKEVKRLTKQAIVAWVLLNAGVVLFATISTFITAFELLAEEQNIIFTTLFICLLYLTGGAWFFILKVGGE